jgi:hypothetical protein
MMKHLALSGLILTTSVLAGLEDFKPVRLETNQFDVSDSKKFRNTSELTSCHFVTSFNKKENVIELKVGVNGSAVNYFGWNMPLAPHDLPLKTDFMKIYEVDGNTTMILTYDGRKLSFQRNKKEIAWNTLYPFELEVDPYLQNPGHFKARVEGYEYNRLGQLKVHLKQECYF